MLMRYKAPILAFRAPLSLGGDSLQLSFQSLLVSLAQVSSRQRYALKCDLHGNLVKYSHQLPIVTFY